MGLNSLFPVNIGTLILKFHETWYKESHFLQNKEIFPQ